jgi:hypothetical protein
MDPAVLERLRDVPLREYAVAALKIVDKNGELVPLDCTGRPGQIKLGEAFERQKAQGRPVRIVLVKSRQFGGSTLVQADMQKRANTTARRKILTVAHRLDTAESLFQMGLTMWENLPDGMQAPMGGFNNPTRGTKIMHLGEKVGGIVSGWPNSRLAIDTAEEVQGGRGLTYTDLHLTEVAFWGQNAKKAEGLLSAVPDRPGTSIVIESTAQGRNWFYTRAKAAADGTSEYELVFVGWHEDPDCWRAFRTPEEREDFVATIGRPDACFPGTDQKLGVIAEDEPWLVEQFGCAPEQLNWRRFAIIDKCDGKLEVFRTEYPATWQEAFAGTGRQVFSVIFTQRAAVQAASWAKKPPEQGGPQQGIFVGQDPRTRKLSDGEVEVPTRAVWVPEAEIPARCEWWPGSFHQPKDPLWTLWMPERRTAEEWRQAHERGDVDLEAMEAGMARAVRGPGQYILAGDAAKDTYNDVPTQMAETAFNTLVGIDHWTGEQVAEWRGRIDHDLVAKRAFLAGLWLNEALVSIELTGGYGGVIMDRLQRVFYYRRLFVEKVLDDRKQREINRLGWDTNRRSKPRMEGTAQALLREGTHGIKSPVLAAEFETYVKDEKNPVKHEPAPGAFSDLLLAWMQAQEIRRIKPARPAPPADGHRPNSMTRKLRY